MTEKNGSTVTASPGTDPEGVYTLYEEMVASIASFKKRPPENYKEFVFWFARDFMPFVRDQAFHIQEHQHDLDQLVDGEQLSQGTQFSLEDAPKFDLVLQAAQGFATTALASPDLPAEDREKLQRILSTAEECLKIVEDSTLPAEESDDEEDEPTAPSVGAS